MFSLGKEFAANLKLISRSYVMVISGWQVGISDFQRNLRFGSKLADRVVEVRKKDEFLSVLSFLWF